jgi:uncharacterized membrane protein YqjE
MSTDEANGAGRPAAGAALQSSLRRLGATLLGIAHTRLELLAIELEDEKRRLLGVLGWGALAILMGGFGLVFLAVWLTVMFWETHRLLALGSFSVLFLGLAAWAVWRAQTLLKDSQGWLSATLDELEADRQALAGAVGAGATPTARPTAGGSDGA